MKKTLTTLAAAVLFATQAQAHHVEQSFDLGDLADKSSIVFKGTVISVDYRGSKAERGNAPLPHTFVTYEVDEVIHGQPGQQNRKTFTLRFMGGKGDKGRDLMVDVIPKFDLGDQDVLFVKGNGASECPLVNCSNGRLRIVDDMVFNEYGQKLVENDKGEIVLGELVEDITFTEHKLGDKIIGIKRHKSENYDEDMPSKDADSGKAFQQLSSWDLSQKLEQGLYEKMPSDPQGKGKSENSADINKPFDVAFAKPTRPTGVIAQAKSSAPSSPEEDRDAK